MRSNYTGKIVVEGKGFTSLSPLSSRHLKSPSVQIAAKCGKARANTRPCVQQHLSDSTCLFTRHYATLRDSPKGPRQSTGSESVRPPAVAARPWSWYRRPIESASASRLLLTAAPTGEVRPAVCALGRRLPLAFRGPLHHALRDDLTRAEALKFCGFIDHFLAILDKAAAA